MKFFSEKHFGLRFILFFVAANGVSLFFYMKKELANMSVSVAHNFLHCPERGSPTFPPESLHRAGVSALFIRDQLA